MKLSEQLKALAEKVKLYEDAITEMAEDGWLYHGDEGMVGAQEICYRAYLDINPPEKKNLKNAVLQFKWAKEKFVQIKGMKCL